MTPELREACARAMHVRTEDGHFLRAGRATLFVLDRLGGAWRFAARVLRVPPFVWAVELGYWFVARNRGWIGPLLLRRSRR